MKSNEIEQRGCLILQGTAAWAPTFIRVALGIIFMAHGSQKLFGAFGGRGVSGTIEGMISLGMQWAAFWGWILAMTEFFGGLAIFLGLAVRFASMLIIVIMIVAIVKVHLKGGFFSPEGVEYNLALIAMSLSLVLTGAGRLCLDSTLRGKDSK